MSWQLKVEQDDIFFLEMLLRVYKAQLDVQLSGEGLISVKEREVKRADNFQSRLEELTDPKCECAISLSELKTTFGEDLDGHVTDCALCQGTGSLHVWSGGQECLLCGSYSGVED